MARVDAGLQGKLFENEDVWTQTVLKMDGGDIRLRIPGYVCTRP